MSEGITKDWKVLDVREGKTEDNPNGPGQLQKFYVGFEGSSDTYWRRKAGNAPKVGETYYGTITPGKYGPMFKSEKKDGGGSGAPRRSRGSDWTPEAQRDPERSARILRQHSQEMAIRLLPPDAKIFTNGPDGIGRPNEKFTALVDWFDADVNQAGQAAIQGAAVGGSPSPEALPSGIGTAAPDSSPVSLEEAEQALDTAAALEGSKRRKVAEFITTQLAPARAVKAVKNLTNTSDLGEQAATVKALIENTEAWIGGPLLTEEKSDDDIPF
jgi:hypothetical protein